MWFWRFFKLTDVHRMQMQIAKTSRTQDVGNRFFLLAQGVQVMKGDVGFGAKREPLLSVFVV